MSQREKSPDPHKPHQTTEFSLHKQARKYDKSSAEIKETVVVTSTTTHLSVPKPGRSSQERRRSEILSSKRGRKTRR